MLVVLVGGPVPKQRWCRALRGECGRQPLGAWRHSEGPSAGELAGSKEQTGWQQAVLRCRG